MPSYSWKPIEPLSDADRSIDLAGIGSLYEVWRESGSPHEGFTDRLIRRISVETGILERLYDLDRGTTEALIARGFSEDLVSRVDTNIDPSKLIDILRDQEAAIQLVVDCIANSRPLTRSLIHELHSILTRHQETTSAIDQFGNRFDIPLLKGKYKEQPNNPRRPDGSVHEYCPPVHVEAEMDNLLTWFADYSHEDPIVVSAWLHHRFTQIHPYQDGNGRLSRVLTTMVLLKARLLPLVIDRDMRVEYIESLETADGGDLSNLALLFARLERQAILQSISGEVVSEPNLTAAVLAEISARLAKRRDKRADRLRQADAVAIALRLRTHSILLNTLDKVRITLSEIDYPFVSVEEGGPDFGNGQNYRLEIERTAEDQTRFINFSEGHFFTRVLVSVGIQRLTFVTSFHHIGSEPRGVMEASAVASVESSNVFFNCSKYPFVFTYKTEITDVAASFDRWLDSAFAVALKQFGDRI